MNSTNVPIPRIEFGIGWEDETGFDTARLSFPVLHGWHEGTTTFHKQTKNGVTRVRIFYRWKIQ